MVNPHLVIGSMSVYDKGKLFAIELCQSMAASNAGDDIRSYALQLRRENGSSEYSFSSCSSDINRFAFTMYFLYKANRFSTQTLSLT
jgi:hypothetical protein